jgi:hypothetical protein
MYPLMLRLETIGPKRVAEQVVTKCYVVAYSQKQTTGRRT